MMFSLTLYLVHYVRKQSFLIVSLVMLTMVVMSPAVRALEEQQLFEQVNMFPELLAQGKLTPDQIPSPHWRDDACRACHAGDPNARPVQLRDRNINGLCQYCHDALFDHSYIHPINVTLDMDMIARMPDTFREAVTNTGGKISCTTCHDLPIQCLKNRRSEKGLNPNFFRGFPFKTRSEPCFFCHDREQYERLNPHEQVTDAGQLRAASCRVCHTEDTEELLSLRGIGNLHFYSNSRLESMCLRCHTVQNHPGGQTYSFRASKEPPNHLVVPNADIRQQMQQQAQLRGIELPLEPGTGKIFCATCHNPHDEGVVQNATPQQVEFVPSEESKKKRLRVNDICRQCHNK